MGDTHHIDKNKKAMVMLAGRFEKLAEPSTASDQVLSKLDALSLLLKGNVGNKKRQLLIKELKDKRVRYVCIKGQVAKIR
ncbi:MAG TPA: hypothetical protein VFI93_06265 [Rhizomicrobium sp.]|nr:hypothetical protein [Rhizomicrobium sp.]